MSAKLLFVTMFWVAVAMALYSPVALFVFEISAGAMIERAYFMLAGVFVMWTVSREPAALADPPA